MAFQSVPETAEAVIKYTLHGELMLNTVHARFVGGYDLADLQNLADVVGAAVVANWLPQQSIDASYDITAVRGLEFENDQEAVSILGNGPGTVASVAMPGNVTLSIKKASTQTGRSARGRLFFLGMPRSFLDTNENFFTSSAATAMQAAVEAVRIAIAGSGWSPVIVSRFTNNAKRPTGVTFFWATTIAVNDNVDSLRGRLSSA